MVAQYEESDSFHGNDHRYGTMHVNNNGNGVERKPLVPDGDGVTGTAFATPITAPCTPPFLKDKELLRDEIAGMANLSVPVIITSVLEMLPSIVTIVLVGRVEDGHGGPVGELGGEGTTTSMQQLHLDAAALAVMLINVVCFAPVAGLLTAMDTLCSQAFGACQTSKMGTYSLTGIAVTTVVFLLSGVLIWHASPILIALGQPVEVSLLAGAFIRYLLPGVLFINIYKLIQKVSQSRNEARPMLITAVVYNAVNLGLGYYLVHWTTWGWMGAAAARTIANFVTVPTVLLCMAIGSGGSDDSGESEDSANLSRNVDEWKTQRYLEVDVGNRADNGYECEKDDSEFLRHIWEGFAVSEALSYSAIMEFLRIGIPGMLQVMFEWVAFEVLALLCGILPGQEAIVGIGAHSIIMNVSSLTWTLYQGVSVSGNVRVGNALGAGDVHRAEIASNLTLASGIVTSIINVAFLLTFRNSLPYLFTSDVDIVRKSRQLILIAAAFQFPDSINCSVQGIFRGSGRQALAAKYNFVAFYVIGIPLAYVLGVRMGFGVEGLWWGITSGLCTIAIGGTITILRSDWRKLAAEASLRLNDD